ncbi:MAG: hypothetical protein L0H23_01005 [Luteimonas sp.]|nr:hypothetical protein [Luteimonas sp.]
MEQNTKSRLAGVVLITGMLFGCQPSQPAPEAETAAPPIPEQAAKPQAPDLATGAESRMHDPSIDMPSRDTTPVDTTIDAVTLSTTGDTERNTLGAPATRFGPQDSVYAEIRSNGTAGAYTIYAKWTGADGTVLADYGIKINEAGPKRTVISLSKPDGWPPGENKIELAINSRVLRTETFKVQ